MKNIYYWYDIPIYADSMFCELRKCRNWEDRNSHGQELVKLRKIKEKNSKLKSRTKNRTALTIPKKIAASRMSRTKKSNGSRTKNRYNIII